jgi:hypothetical protein
MYFEQIVKMLAFITTKDDLNQRRVFVFHLHDSIDCAKPKNLQSVSTMTKQLAGYRNKFPGYFYLITQHWQSCSASESLIDLGKRILFSRWTC